MTLRIQILLLALSFFTLRAFSSNKNDTIDNVKGKPKRVYNTVRLSTEKPIIDGVLNDACWETGEWAGNYTQWVPNEGAKPTYPTYLKILYDDKNVYVAVRAIDGEPDKISRKMGRRDHFAGDVVGICFDSYHDYRTGFEFDVTAAGQKVDAILTNPYNADRNWDAVWIAKTALEDSAWTAEFEIPLSQLRYSNQHEQTWGLHAWRWIDRLYEESDWEVQTSTGPGMLYAFGELRGINGLPKSRRIEIMPYALGKYQMYEKEPDNPFTKKGYEWGSNIGLDAKIGLTSNFTVDLTINPDFGQVESDPSQINLTAFETFYQEKRQFFLEGRNIFDVEFDDVMLFYSRRIGHAPSYSPDLDDNEHVNVPDNTTILSAVKLSGKTSDGLSIGVLQSLTANELADFDSAGVKSETGVEPLTSYTIARVQQDFKQGNTVIGGMFTSTNRFINDSHLNFLSREAYAGGVDLHQYWNDKEYYVNAKLIGSYIKGHANSITELQRSSARYYQREDVDYVRLDSSRTQLSGHGGSIKIGKGSKGLWRYSTLVSWCSPGIELNDLGYMKKADYIKQKNSVSYFVNRPVSIFRTYNVELNQINNWDFGFRYLSSEARLSAYMEFLNKWAIYEAVHYKGRSLDTRILRGGQAMFIPEVWSNGFYIGTDYSKRIFLNFSSDYSISGDKSGQNYSFHQGFSVLPINKLRFTINMMYAGQVNHLQYVDTKTVDNENKYLLGKISQKTLNFTFRADYNITPEFSIQYYGSPFASVGQYIEFKEITNPQSDSYNDRYLILTPVLMDDEYQVSENNNTQIDYAFDNPDFNYSQFRSNFVIRWEYRSGSQIYFVWSHERTDNITSSNASVSKVFNTIKDINADNVFLVKFNYWFSI